MSGANPFPAGAGYVVVGQTLNAVSQAQAQVIVAEVIGTMSGITLFINQQARYRNFDNVYAAIAMIGIIGVSTDMFLSWLGGNLFPWKRSGRGSAKKLSLFPSGKRKRLVGGLRSGPLPGH